MEQNKKDPFELSEQEKKQTCTHCGGKFTQKAKFRQSDGNMSEWQDTACLASGTSTEIWESAYFLAKQFIRCEVDNKDGKCEGCEYEREEMMSYLWHYGQALVKEQNGTQPSPSD